MNMTKACIVAVLAMLLSVTGVANAVPVTKQIGPYEASFELPVGLVVNIEPALSGEAWGENKFQEYIADLNTTSGSWRGRLTISDFSKAIDPDLSNLLHVQMQLLGDAPSYSTEHRMIDNQTASITVDPANAVHPSACVWDYLDQRS